MKCAEAIRHSGPTLSLIILLFSAAACGGENPHVSKAKDWIELGKYRDAIRELHLAIQDEPKSKVARELLIETHLRVHGYKATLSAYRVWVDFAKLDADSQRVGKLRARLVARTTRDLTNLPAGQFRTPLWLSGQLRDSAFVSGLQRVAAIGTNYESRQAVRVLRLIPPPESGRKRVEAVFGRADLRADNGLRIAAEAWREVKSNVARAYLVSRYKQGFSKAKSAGSARWNAQRLMDVDQIAAMSLFRETFANGAVGTSSHEVAIEFILRYRDKPAIDLAAKEVRAALESRRKTVNRSFCSRRMVGYTTLLSRVRAADYEPLVIKALERVIVYGRRARRTGCSTRYWRMLSTLSNGAEWRTLTDYKTSGHPFFSHHNALFFLYLVGHKDPKIYPDPDRGSVHREIEVVREQLGRHFKMRHVWLGTHPLQKAFALESVSLVSPTRISMVLHDASRGTRLSVVLVYRPIEVPKRGLGGFIVRGQTVRESRWAIHRVSISH